MSVWHCAILLMPRDLNSNPIDKISYDLPNAVRKLIVDCSAIGVHAHVHTLSNENDIR